LLWPAIIGMYGVLRPGISQLRLSQEDGTEVIGTIAVDPNDARFVLFDVDTDSTPQNTLTNITAIIDPLVSAPGEGLPAAAQGQRYLLTDNVGAAVPWIGEHNRQISASANDIIEYDGTCWRIVFLASAQGGGQYVTNLTTGIQYEWNATNWVKSYQGFYPGGTWRLVL